MKRMKKEQILIIALAIVVLLGGMYALKVQVTKRTAAARKQMLAENEQREEQFLSAQERNQKLEIYKTVKSDYESYKSGKNCRKEILKDYEEKISDMKKQLMEYYEQILDVCGEIEDWEPVPEETDKNTFPQVPAEKYADFAVRYEGMSGLKAYMEAEKDILFSDGNPYKAEYQRLWGIYEDALERNSELQEYVENARKTQDNFFVVSVLRYIVKIGNSSGAMKKYQESNYDITDEKEFYEKYIGYVREVFRDYPNIQLAGDTYTLLELDVSEKITELLDSETPSLGYYVEDLDGNGVRELLIGNTASENEIYNIFTIKDGKMVPVLSAEDTSDRYVLCEDNVIHNCVQARNGNAEDSLYKETNQYYSCKEDGLEIIEIVTVEETEGGTVYSYGDRNSTLKFEPAVMISEGEYQEIREKYKARKVSFTSL